MSSHQTHLPLSCLFPSVYSPNTNLHISTFALKIPLQAYPASLFSGFSSPDCPLCKDKNNFKGKACFPIYKMRLLIPEFKK